jgi:hypothetical protein
MDEKSANLVTLVETKMFVEWIEMRMSAPFDRKFQAMP